LEEGCGRWPFDYAQDEFQGQREGKRDIGAEIARPKHALDQSPKITKSKQE